MDKANKLTQALSRAKIHINNEVNNQNIQQNIKPQPTYTPQPQQYISEQIVTPRQNNSGLPMEIFESITSNPLSIENNGLYNIDGVGTSVLDMVDTNQIQPTYTPQPQQYVSEQINPQIQYTNTNSIDYSLIKTIINECIREQFNENKNKLNENALQTIQIVNNNKIRLMDVKGNVFESDLKFIKNVKNKQ